MVFRHLLHAPLLLVCLLAHGPEEVVVGPEPEHTAVPTLPETPFPYADMAFPESWLNDPALQLSGGSVLRWR